MVRKEDFKITKCCLTLFLAFSLTLASMSFCVSAANANSEQAWKTAYTKILDNWEIVENYSDAGTDYLKQYFGTDYQFDHYFLCDVDKNGTPEFFLYSSTMGLTTVFTCKNGKLVCLGCDDYYKMNTSKHEIVVKGHWHGAGGSGDKEWYIYKISGTKCKMTYYIDNLNGQYSIYDGSWNSLETTKAAYNKIYKKHCKAGKKFASYKKYKLTNKSGLDK